MSKYSLCVIILAAGNSTRFNGNKLLYNLAGQPMYQHTLNLARQLNPESLIVVSQYPEILRSLPTGVIGVTNSHPEAGQAYSLVLGLQRSISEYHQFSHYLFLVADQPYLTLKSLQRLYRTAQQHDGICALSYAGQRRHPVIFNARYRDELLQLTGDTGGRTIIEQHLSELKLVPVKDSNELKDIDTPEDLI